MYIYCAHQITSIYYTMKYITFAKVNNKTEYSMSPTSLYLLVSLNILGKSTLQSATNQLYINVWAYPHYTQHVITQINSFLCLSSSMFFWRSYQSFPAKAQPHYVLRGRREDEVITTLFTELAPSLIQCIARDVHGFIVSLSVPQVQVFYWRRLETSIQRGSSLNC